MGRGHVPGELGLVDGEVGGEGAALALFDEEGVGVGFGGGGGGGSGGGAAEVG